MRFATQISGCEVVIHTAYDFAGDQERQKKTALEGTRHVCEAVLKNAVARLVYTSSFAVYGWSRNGDLTEASPWQAGGEPLPESEEGCGALDSEVPPRSAGTSSSIAAHSGIWSLRRLDDGAGE